MKKKAKLFTTIASLCMAVALMAFGVYAATSATLNVTSTVGFTATGVSGSLTLNVSGTATNVDAITGTFSPASNAVEGTNITDGSAALGALKFKTADGCPEVIKYTIVVTNTGAHDLDATITMTEGNATTNLEVNKDGTGYALTGVAKAGETGNTCTLVVTVKVTDESKDVASDSQINFTLALTQHVSE